LTPRKTAPEGGAETNGVNMSTIKTCLLASAFILAAAPAAAQTVVSQTGGRLSLTTPNGDQSLKAEVGPIPGVVRVSGFPGVPDGREYSGVTGLAIQTGAGKDSVEVEVDSAQSLDVSIDTGAGESQSKVKWKIAAGVASATANVDISSATAGVQVASVEIDSEAQNAAITVRAPTASEAQVKVNSSNASTFLKATIDSAAPKLSVDLSSEASALEVDLRAAASSRTREATYSILQGRVAPVSVNWAVDGSGSADRIEGKIVAPGGTITQRGQIRTLGGDDTVTIETDSFGAVTGLVINGGAGRDVLSQAVKGRFFPSQTLQTRMLGADGDDDLILTTDTGIFGTGLPNDLFPIIDCGNGNDRFNAFGVIRSCEARL